MAAKLPSTARERSGKADPRADAEVIPVEVGLVGEDGSTEWVSVDIDFDDLTFREIDAVRGALADLAAPTARTNTLLAAWAILRRSRATLTPDDVLNLPNRNLIIGDPRPVGEAEASGESGGAG